MLGLSSFTGSNQLLGIFSIVSLEKSLIWGFLFFFLWQGRVIFHESSEFWIELLTTTPEKQNNSHVKISYTSIDDNHTILLQVVCREFFFILSSLLLRIPTYLSTK